jgi:antitoxin (DNA-binding transcriptional repressor) of toxin-antitoxin stability system
MPQVNYLKKEANTIMKHIVLTAEQARVALEAGEPVEVRDERGRTVAHLTPLHPADIEAIERAKRTRGLGGPRIPSDQVQAHLQRLGEIREREGMDEAKMLDLLRRLRAREQV